MAALGIVLTVRVTQDERRRLNRQAKRGSRTLAGQIRYYVHEGLLNDEAREGTA